MTTASVPVGQGSDGVAVYVQLQPDGGGLVYKHGQRPVEGVAVHRFTSEGLVCDLHGYMVKISKCEHIAAVLKAIRFAEEARS